MDDCKQPDVTDTIGLKDSMDTIGSVATNQYSASCNPQTLIDRLQHKIHQLETSARCGGEEVVSTGVPFIDGLLPAGGFPRGTLIEWFAPAHGCGSEILSLLAARAAMTATVHPTCNTGQTTASNSTCTPSSGHHGGALVVIDSQQTFYSPAAVAWGIDLERTIVIRQANPQKMRWAINQCLRSTAVAVVWGYLGEVDERWLRRFQLSAEEGGTLGLFYRPQALRQLPSWSEIQWWVQPHKIEPVSTATRPGWGERTVAEKQQRHFRLHLLRCRGGLSGKSLDLRLDLQTGQLTRQPSVSRTGASPKTEPSQVRSNRARTHEQPCSLHGQASAIAAPLASGYPYPSPHALHLVAGLADSASGGRSARA